MDLEKRLEVIKRAPTEEIIIEQDLRGLLETNDHPSHYIGYEISGLLHIGSLILPGLKIKDFIQAGCSCRVFLADWHAWINDKMGGDLERIKTVGEYFVEVWKAAGVDMGQIDVVWASDLVNSAEAKVTEPNRTNRERQAAHAVFVRCNRLDSSSKRRSRKGRRRVLI
jgi:tyrosyl-tRNA synthetase